MNLCMLARNPGLYSHRRLCEAAKARGHDIQVVNTLRCYMNITSHRPELHYNGRRLEGFDAVIPRIGASVTYYGLAVLRQFEMMGVWPLNESVAIGRARDKLRSMQLLARAGIGLPDTAFAHDPKQTAEVLKLVGGAPVIIKLIEGTQGIGVVLGETELRYVIRTELTLAGRSWPIDITLTNRERMELPMLIGREALAGRVLVDADRSWVCGQPLASAADPRRDPRGNIGERR